MKNILNYYYHMILNDSDLENGYFTYNNYHFCLYEYKRSLEEVNALWFINNYMLNNRIPINKIILNVNNEVITYYEGKNYVLFLLNNLNNKISFRPYLALLNDKTEILKRNNWAYLWSMKVDYIEYQMFHLENKYPIINKSINYYIGLAENAIEYFKMIKLDHESLYFNHRRMNKKNFYNPMEIVIDYKVRDICEYFKKAFFKNEMSIMEIKSVIKNLELSYIDCMLLYVRMLYPSFYFDIYENIVNNNLEEEKILVITDKVSLYEELLFEIYQVIVRKYNILGIEWINKKFI